MHSFAIDPALPTDHVSDRLVGPQFIWQVVGRRWQVQCLRPCGAVTGPQEHHKRPTSRAHNQHSSQVGLAGSGKCLVLGD